MGKFIGLTQFIRCFTENLIDGSGLTDSDLIQILERRRFGVNTSGVINYDPILGEPIYVNNQTNYISNMINCRAEIVENVVDSSSHVGGRPDPDKEYCRFKVSLDADIVEGDVIIFPVGSNKSYIVDKDRIEDAGLKRLLYCYSEVKSTK